MVIDDDLYDPVTGNDCLRYGSPMSADEWIADIEHRLPAIESSIGYPIGDMLGCGHYGCVYESSDDLVVKLSVDPHEGYIWSRIVDLFNHTPASERWRLYGVARPKHVFRLDNVVLPAGRLGDISCYLWCIVREDVEADWDQRLPEEDVMEFNRWLSDYTFGAREEAIQNVPPLFSNIGHTLQLLAEHGLVLGDLHFGNIGYRILGSDEENGPVVLDPGGTPSDPVPIQKLKANPEDAQAPPMRERDPSWALRAGDKFVVTKGSAALGIQIRNTGTVRDVWRRPGERDVLVSMAFTWPLKPKTGPWRHEATLYATHPNRLSDNEIALMNSRGDRILIRKRAP